MPITDPSIRAAHLLRRAGFGAPPALVAKYAAMPYANAVETLLTFPAQTAPAGSITHLLQKKTFSGWGEIRRWWLDLMLKSRYPLQEKMVLFWHGHFATSDHEVDNYFMLLQNQFFRRNALASFRTLLEGVTLDPAMLVWLDGTTNRATHPNENYSREAMELFSLGLVDPVTGARNYTEDDVRAGAQIFSGWRMEWDTHRKYYKPNPYFVPGDHYTKGDPSNPEAYTFLGVNSTFNNTAKGSSRTGDAAYKQAIDAILNLRHDANAPTACARWMAYKLWRFFGYEWQYTNGRLISDDAALCDRLATTFYADGAYNTKALLRAIFTAPEFLSDRAYRGVIKSPVEVYVGTLRELGAKQQIKWGQYIPGDMGQDVFAPPNVKGWDGGKKWISGDTLLSRFNYAKSQSESWADKQQGINYLKAMATVHTADGAIDYYARLFRDGILSAAERADLKAYLTDPARNGIPDLDPSTYKSRWDVRQKLSGLLHLLMATPDYQLN